MGDRFPDLILSSRVDRDEDGRTEPVFSAAGPQCENCRETVDRISWVEGWDYWGCDECQAEAVAADAREAREQAELEQLAQIMLAEAERERAETLALLRRARLSEVEVAAYMAVYEEIA